MGHGGIFVLFFVLIILYSLYLEYDSPTWRDLNLDDVTEHFIHTLYIRNFT